MEPINVRRHPDNSIDHDFYRRRAARLRTEAMRESVRGMASMIKPRIKHLIAVALLLGVMLAMPARAPQPANPAAEVAATGSGDTLKAN